MENEVLYEDSNMKLTKTQLYLYYYWFPTGQTKVIQLSDIRSVKLYRPRNSLGLKHWGMGVDMEVWWHCDSKRPVFLNETNAIVIDISGWPKVGITPNHGSTEIVELVFNKLRDVCTQATFLET